MTRNEYKKLNDFPKDKLIDIIKEEDRLIKVISECCVDADKDGNYEYAMYKIKTYLCDIYNPINCAAETYADALDRDPFFLEEAETEAILDKEIAEAKAWQKEQQEKYKLYKLTPREETIAKFKEYTNCNKEK